MGGGFLGLPILGDLRAAFGADNPFEGGISIADDEDIQYCSENVVDAMMMIDDDCWETDYTHSRQKNPLLSL